MKKIGLIGGTSWESTLDYYRAINTLTGVLLEKNHSAPMAIESVDFEEIYRGVKNDDWDSIVDFLSTAANSLHQSGAEIGLLCSNTMHKVYDKVAENTDLKLLHIQDSLLDRLKQREIYSVGLLGTSSTMQDTNYLSKLEANGVSVVVPTHKQMDKVDRIIFEELCKGRIEQNSTEYLSDIVSEWKSKSVQGVVLGCTELQQCMSSYDVELPLFDTMYWHAVAAVNYALDD